MQTFLVGLYKDGAWFAGNGSYASFHFVSNLNRHIHGYNILQFKKETVVGATGISKDGGLILGDCGEPIIK